MRVRQQRLPLAVVSTRVKRRLAEHEPVVLPGRSGSQPLRGLGRPVLLHRVAQLSGQGDGPPAGPGLGLHQHEALALLPLERLAHRQQSAVEVDGVPGQSQRFALPQPQRERHRPSGRVPASGRRREDPPCLHAGEGLHFGALERGCVDEGADVAGQLPALHGDLERPRQHAVTLQDGGWRQAAGQEFTVELLDVLGLQPVESVISDPRQELVHGQ
jgi:hypothetical protein